MELGRLGHRLAHLVGEGRVRFDAGGRLGRRLGLAAASLGFPVIFHDAVGRVVLCHVAGRLDGEGSLRRPRSGQRLATAAVVSHSINNVARSVRLSSKHHQMGVYREKRGR